jgi:hypothetical protein
MRTIFKLLIVGILVNATVRGGQAAWNYYELKDAASQLLTFGDRTPTSSLRSSIIKKAAELNLPVASQNVAVHRQGVRTWAEASYVQTLELLPNYPYPMTFSFAVDAYSLTPGVPEDTQ